MRYAPTTDANPASARLAGAGGWRGGSMRVIQHTTCNAAATKGTLSMVDLYRQIVPELPQGLLVLNSDANPCLS